MKEAYLHHLFQSKILGNSFFTVDNQSLEVLEFGILNVNAGPDFQNVKIRYKNMILAGSIEFHVKASDWYQHGHERDANYKNVIAHFVYINDCEVEADGEKIPTVELRHKVDLNHFQKFEALVNSPKSIPCASQINTTSEFVLFQQKQRALFSRLERKAKKTVCMLEKEKGDLQKLFYRLVAAVFGGNVNADAFDTLMTQLDYRQLIKLRDQPTAIPAILFGTAGLLPASSDDLYVSELIKEFDFQKHRLHIHPMKGVEFRFSRMMPYGFPTIRMAQLAAIIQQDIPISKILDESTAFETLRSYFNPEIPKYWQTHYRFEQQTQLKSSSISKDFFNKIMINAIIPFLFSIGLKNNDQALKERCLKLLENLEPETNQIIKEWNRYQIKAKNAFDSQALIEQKNEFCSKKKCLFCNIGIHALKS